MNIINTLRTKAKVFYIEESSINTFLNPYSYSIARKNNSIFDKFDNLFIDGILLVKIINIFRISKVNRYSFDMTSAAPSVYEYAIKNNKGIYFVGSKESEVNAAINNILNLFPKLNIIGYRNGYFNSPKEREEFILELKGINPDILVVGMGTPLQETFLIDLKKTKWNGIGFTCGGYLHQTATKTIYFPEWSNKLHLRWLIRLLREPSLFLRHLKSHSLFPFIFLIDLYNSCKK